MLDVDAARSVLRSGLWLMLIAAGYVGLVFVVALSQAEKESNKTKAGVSALVVSLAYAVLYFFLNARVDFFEGLPDGSSQMSNGDAWSTVWWIWMGVLAGLFLLPLCSYLAVVKDLKIKEENRIYDGFREASLFVIFLCLLLWSLGLLYIWGHGRAFWAPASAKKAEKKEDEGLDNAWHEFMEAAGIVEVEAR